MSDLLVLGSHNVEYLEPMALAEAIDESKEKERNFIIVDVRDDDYPGGHIVGSINRPSEIFQTDEIMNELLTEYGLKKTYVFHCFKSYLR